MFRTCLYLAVQFLLQSYAVVVAAVVAVVVNMLVDAAVAVVGHIGAYTHVAVADGSIVVAQHFGREFWTPYDGDSQLLYYDNDENVVMSYLEQ